MVQTDCCAHGRIPKLISAPLHATMSTIFILSYFTVDRVPLSDCFYLFPLMSPGSGLL